MVFNVNGHVYLQVGVQPVHVCLALYHPFGASVYLAHSQHGVDIDLFVSAVLFILLFRLMASSFLSNESH